jgi:P pilus assembly chaperone PapD
MFRRSFLGMSLLAVLFPPIALAQDTTTGPTSLPNNTLGLFVVSVGALPTDYTPVGPVDATSFLFSMVIPSTKQWVVIDKETSESYASNTMYVFEQDSNVYQVIADGANTNYVGPCDFSHVAGTTGPSIPALSNGCTVDHLGYVGNSVYFRVPSTWDVFNNCYCIGGEFQVMTNNKATTLLSRTDADNQATMDIADNGTLYAITHDTQNGSLKVSTRNLTTGRLQTLLRNYTITESLFDQCCSFKINDGILYFGVVRKADHSVEIWTTDLTVPLASQTVPGVLQTYPASAGVSGGIYVTNGKVAQSFSSSSIKNGIAVLDVATGSTQYYDMGSNIQITSFAPLWIPGPTAAILPQFAFGGGWYSALYFTNLSGTAVSFPVSFVSDAGTPLAVPALAGSTTQVNLAADGAAIIEAPNQGSLLEGYAGFTLPSGVYGYGVFRQSVAGRADQEAVVPLSAANATSSALTWDETNFVTAVAVVNPSATATTVAVTLWDENGHVIGTSSIPLPPNSKTETTLRTLPGLSGMVGQRGSAQFAVSSGNVAVLGLRFNGSAFTSIPTTTGSPTNPASSVLPQFAFGGGWYSALYFTNLTGSAVSFPVSFVSDAGTPLAVPALAGSTTQVNLAAYGTAIIEAPNVGSLFEGYAEFALPSGVYGYGVFRQSVAGRADQEAVVPFSDAGASSSTLTWDETNFITAVAVVNPGSTADNVIVTLWGENGNVIGTSLIALPPNSKTETALRTLPGLSGMEGQRGSAQFTASGGSVAVLGLRFDGSAFTSIPTTH